MRNKMIDYEITKYETGIDKDYFDNHLNSHKKVYVRCQMCDCWRWTEYRLSDKLCKSCALKDRKLTDKHKQNICKGMNKNNQKMIKCLSCNEMKKHYAKGLCGKCYRRKYYRKSDKSMANNRSCPQYLGIIVAEQILSKVFKNVEIMPYGNPGYDFICNNGYKIDVKASIMRKQNNWTFLINKNVTANYFLLLTFDNRENLNPKYIWLIPGNIINNKKLISISESTINKWDEYKLDVNKVINCCNKIKSKSNRNP